MCGIFTLLNNDTISTDIINNQFMKGHNRGPEFSTLQASYPNMLLGFHRLAINGLNEASNQPFIMNDIVLICNGEIYNYQKLYTLMGITPTTGSDCEVIIHLYLKYGIEQTLQMLDGVFAFILYDTRNNTMYIARDPYGVRPIYYLKNVKNTTTTTNNNNNNLCGFASELKCLSEIYNRKRTEYYIEQFKPGTYSVFNMVNEEYWQPVQEYIPYFIPSFSYNLEHLNSVDQSKEFDTLKVADYLNSAVTKRCLTTERPIACLLSGGLDSSLVTALVDNFYKTNGYKQELETYSIGLAGSEDLKYARIVADYLGTKHTEVLVTEKEMFDAIPEVIYQIESYDTTTVRASIGNYLVSKYITKNSQAKVIFNGDGSDEVCGGYLYMNKCPDDIEFDKETRRLLKDIHLFDVLRSDKSISSNGLEPRTPFLDRSFVNYYLSIPPSIRNHNNGSTPQSSCEKFLLRNSFSLSNFKNYKGTQILPNEVLWRKKEAFSDGVSSKGRSLFQILQEYISYTLGIETSKKYPANIETEKYYYKMYFDGFYPHCEHIIPYFWMPKYTNATDPSARTLDIYTLK